MYALWPRLTVMSRRQASSPRLQAQCSLIGCVADDATRRRIEGAMRDHGTLEWCQNFAHVRTRLSHRVDRVDVAILDKTDPLGATAGAFARELAASYPGLGIVVYLQAIEAESELCALGAAGVHDLIIGRRPEEPFRLRAIILGVRRRGAADRVMSEIAPVIPQRLVDFVAAVLNAPEIANLSGVTERMGVHRQTPNGWCRRSGFLSAEELFTWCRMLLVCALLETTSRTVESIAYEFDYASATALRNQLKRYTAMTATEIRSSGLGAVLQVFGGRVEQCRAGLTGRAPGEFKQDSLELMG